MIDSFIRPESRITEVLRINSHIGGINELEFGYSQLSEIHSAPFEKESYLKSTNPIYVRMIKL